MGNKQDINLIISIFCLIGVLIAGCSNTVTQMPSFGNELLCEVNMAGTVDLVNNRYFILFSTLEAYQIPLPPPNSQDEFLEVGDEPQPGGLSKYDYFNKYYSTWTAYVVADSSGYSFVKGPFIYGATPSKEAFASIDSSSNKLSFSIQLERIFGNTLPQHIYFDVITVSYPANSLKILADRITPPTVSFDPIKGTIMTKTDEINLSSPPSLEITGYKISLP